MTDVFSYNFNLSENNSLFALFYTVFGRYILYVLRGGVRGGAADLVLDLRHLVPAFFVRLREFDALLQSLAALDDEFHDKARAQHDRRDEPAADDLRVKLIVAVNAAVDVSAVHEHIDDIPAAERHEHGGRDELDRPYKPPFWHFVFFRVLVDLIPHLARLKEPAHEDTLRRADEDEIDHVRPVVDDVQPAQSRARDEDNRDRGHDEHEVARRFFLIELELVTERARHAFGNGERGVDRERGQRHIEDDREDRVQPAEVGELHERHGVDDKRRRDARVGDIRDRVAAAVHRREQHDAGQNADEQVGERDDHAVHGDVRFLVQIRAVGEDDRHHDGQGIEDLPDRVDPQHRVGHLRKVGYEQLAECLAEVRVADEALDREDRQQDNGDKDRIFDDLAHARRAVADAPIDQSPGRDRRQQHAERDIAARAEEARVARRLNDVVEEKIARRFHRVGRARHRTEVDGRDDHRDDPGEHDRVITADDEAVEDRRPAHVLAVLVDALERFWRASAHMPPDRDLHAQHGHAERDHRHYVNEQESAAAVLRAQAGKAPAVAETHGRAYRSKYKSKPRVPSFVGHIIPPKVFI